MKYLIIGASSGLGRELAYEYAKNKHDLILVSRDLRDLSATKSDLERKFEINIETIQLDLTSEKLVEKELFTERFLKDIKGILFPIGMMFDEDTVNLNHEKVEKIFKSNFASIVFIISKYLKPLSSKGGELIAFGSISGYLGRKTNPNYAASKRALESYFESLGFVSNNTSLNIQFYVLGYLNTNLAFGKNLNLPKASPQKLAKIVYRNRKSKFKKAFFPSWWRLVTILLRLIPIRILFFLNKFSNEK